MKRRLYGLGGDERGAVAPTVALSLFALIAAGGIAFDYARLASMDTELQQAADQAALAAATQLDGAADSMTRAEAAARSLLVNQSRMANDGKGFPVTVAAWATGDAGPPPIVFYDSRADAEAGTDEFTSAATTRAAEAKFVRVRVAAREALYALTPVVGAIRSGSIDAQAVAGMGSAICKVPPLMICNPTPGTTFDAAAWRGRGIRTVSRGPKAAWSPGGFGFLGPGDTPSTQEGMAYENPVFACQSIDSGNVDTGNPVPAITAVNTRFDIYDYGSGEGGTLASCLSGACPAAENVTKGWVHTAGLTSSSSCKFASDGWRAPTNPFDPVYDADNLPDPGEPIDVDGVEAMGLPRDNCHYGYGSTCDKFGDGNWARYDYWNANHPSETPPADYATMTRYEVYRYEIENNHIPHSPGHPAPGPVGGVQQYGKAICNPHAPDPTRDRRVFVVAIGNNCDELSGTSTPVDIGSWVEMFFVEPAATINGGGGAKHGEIYLEVIGEAEVDGEGSNAQVVRRDVPYLVK